MTIVMGNKNFSQNYAMDVHDLGCANSEIFSNSEIYKYNISNKIKQNSEITLALGSCKPPLNIAPSANIDNNIAQQKELYNLANEINALTTQSNKTNVKIVSSDRNTAPLIEKLNAQKSIKNIDGKPVNITVIGPKEGESNLANIMKDITNTLIQENENIQDIYNTLSSYYKITELRPQNTMLAFPNGDDSVFIIDDPNMSYLTKNPKEFDTYQKYYKEIDGVYYEGIVVSNNDLNEIMEKDRSNLIIISNQDNKNDNKFTVIDRDINSFQVSAKLYPNGSVSRTVKEDEVNIHSFAPQTLMKNIKLVSDTTDIGDQTLGEETPTVEQRKKRAQNREKKKAKKS